MKSKIIKKIIRAADKPLDTAIKRTRRATGRTAVGTGRTLKEKRESLDKQLAKQRKTDRKIKGAVYGTSGVVAGEKSTRTKKSKAKLGYKPRR